MRATGIVRRIDELGRVVIPKEIRKTLRIREGDPLEIYTEKDELLLKKYSPILNFEGEAKALASAIYEATERICFITDNDMLVTTSNNNKYKEMIGKPITEELSKVLKERKSVIINLSDGGKLLPLIKGETLEVGGQIVVPILSESDVIGSVITLAKKDGVPMDASEIRLVSLGALVLGKQFSE
jgi:stage V sporulation protein T